jgi:uncharacterized protein YjdB
LALAVGASETLTATVAPADAADKSGTWSSSDDTIATIDQAGKVTAIAAGTATWKFTTKDGSFTAECVGTITAPTEG